MDACIIYGERPLPIMHQIFGMLSWLLSWLLSWFASSVKKRTAARRELAGRFFHIYEDDEKTIESCCKDELAAHHAIDALRPFSWEYRLEFFSVMYKHAMNLFQTTSADEHRLAAKCFLDE